MTGWEALVWSVGIICVTILLIGLLIAVSARVMSKRDTKEMPNKIVGIKSIRNEDLLKPPR